MRVALRPTLAGDLARVGVGAPPYRIQALTAVADGEVIGVGGIGFRPDGVVIAFVHVKPQARHYQVALHRAGRAAMRMIESSGQRRVIAEADPAHPAAARWLERLGFQPLMLDGEQLMVDGRATFLWQAGS